MLVWRDLPDAYYGRKPCANGPRLVILLGHRARAVGPLGEARPPTGRSTHGMNQRYASFDGGEHSPNLYLIVEAGIRIDVQCQIQLQLE